MQHSYEIYGWTASRKSTFMLLLLNFFFFGNIIGCLFQHCITSTASQDSTPQQSWPPTNMVTKDFSSQPHSALSCSHSSAFSFQPTVLSYLINLLVFLNSYSFSVAFSQGVCILLSGALDYFAFRVFLTLNLSPLYPTCLLLIDLFLEVHSF